jgi:delta 1-pyrroline-5-carboxylate dehydrogenase
VAAALAAGNAVVAKPAEQTPLTAGLRHRPVAAGGHPGCRAAVRPRGGR